jgi:hypothetical protein
VVVTYFKVLLWPVHGESETTRDGLNASQTHVYIAGAPNFLRFETIFTFSFLPAGHQFINENNPLKHHGNLLENETKLLS